MICTEPLHRLKLTQGTSVEIPHTSIQGIKLEGDKVTDDNGAATFEKYEANGNKYDYYLVETQAPRVTTFSTMP